MKSTKFCFFAIIAFLAIGLSINSCKKDKTTTLTDSELMNQSSSDDQDIQDIQNAMDKDVTDYMSGLSMTKGSNDSTPPCGMQVVGTPNIETKTYTLKYDGTWCLKNDPKRKKSGTVIITLVNGNHWKDIGAVINVKYNVTIIKIASGKTIYIKGNRSITNVKGGRWWDLIAGDTIIHKVNATNAITFPDGTTRSWNHKVIRSWVHPAPLAPYILTISAWGDTLGFNNLATWGVNRNGNNFFTQIITPVVASSKCNWAPSLGVCKHTLITSDTTYIVSITFGLDSNGSPVNWETICADHFKIDWTGKKGITGSAVISY